MKKNSLSFFILAAFLSGIAVSLSAKDTDYRNREIDSLEYILQTGPTAEKLLQIYDDLSWKLMIDNFAKASHYARTGIALAERDRKWIDAAQLYCNLGTTYSYANRFDSAIIIYHTAIQTVERMSIRKKDDERRRDKVLSTAYGNIGNMYGMQSKDNQSLHYFLKAKELFEKWDNEINLTILYGNLGHLYISLENFEQAFINLKKAEEGLLAMNDSIQLTYVLDGLCTVYCHQTDFRKALECAETQYRIQCTHPEGTIYGRMLAELSLANVRATGGQFEKAKEYATMALKDAEILDNRYYQATALARLAKYCLYSGQYLESREFAELSVQTDTADIYRISRVYNVMSATEFALGNHVKARDLHTKFEEMLQKRVNRQYQQSLLEMEVIYETEKKEMQIAALTTERQLFLLLAIAGCGLALLTFALLLYRNRLHHRQQQLIATQAVLDGETEERTRLARDLHDGLGSMLTGVKLNLESAKNGILPNKTNLIHFDSALKILNESILELRRVAHNLMPDSLSRYGLKTALTDFCNNFPAVEFDYFGREERPDSQMEVMIYRIIHELVNNALKHSEASQIMVQVIHDVEYIGIIVRDNGRGFDISADVKGMGLQNIRDRVASHSGRMEVGSKPGEGTEINVEFKINN